MTLIQLWRKLRYGEPVIIVSGLPRSGTSMLMKMLAAGGLEIVSDGLRSADEDNPKGYFELEKIKDLDKNTDKSWLKDLRGKCVKIISFLLRDLPDNNNYRLIFVDRHLEEVIASQNKMLVRRGETGGATSDEKMIENYREHLKRIKNMLAHKPCFEVLYLNHHDVISNPEEISRQVNDFLGLELDLDKMVTSVDPSLYRNRKVAP